MSIKAKAYWAAIVASGATALALSLALWNPGSAETPKFLLYLAAAVATSGLKIRIPGVLLTLSMNYVFIVAGLLELQPGAVLTIGIAGIFAQSFIRHRDKPRVEQVIFNALAISLPIVAGDVILRLHWLERVEPTGCLALMLACMAYFLVNTWTVAGIIAFTTGKRVSRVWRESFMWTSPHYLVGGAIAGGLHLLNRSVGWLGLLLALPALYLIYRSYAIYLGRLEEHQRHVTEMASLHWRTIEALALAIDAKDDTTATHLQRVQVYASEIAKELRIPEIQRKALDAAALLHDIGKLAVPEHIISKPGRLTPEEFDKMKIHPVVGAEILERVKFPYPVVPIVRSHHEKFDGTGYPDGLTGEQIPIGARILAAVDCLDALASHRQYRPALALEDAMAIVSRESGKSFDPAIVAVLERRYRELEAKAKAETVDCMRISTHFKVERGAAPDAGFAAPAISPSAQPAKDFTMALAAARQEFHKLSEITTDLGDALGLDETLALLAVRLKHTVPHDLIVIFVCENDRVVPRFVNGESFRLFSSLEIPMGQGLSGWVAENNRAIVNGNPAVEAGYLNDPRKITALRSAISVPLEGHNGVLGVISLYSLGADVFHADHLRTLQAISPKAGLVLENALRLRDAAALAVTDDLTGLPNAKSLLRHLQDGISHCDGTPSSIAVVIVDVDGLKAVNDVFGHLVGNRILQAVANGLRNCCRESDYVARFGRDEFVMTLPRAEDHVLASVILRIDRLAHDIGARICGKDVIGISSGSAVYPRDAVDADGLLQHAGHGMHDVKHARSTRRLSRTA